MNETRTNTWKQFKKDFPYLGVMAIGVAFMGWLAENILRAIAVGVIDCRYHLLPFISPYGLAVFGLYLLLGDADHIAFFGKPLFKERTKKTKILSNIICFILPCLLVFSGEILVGHLWDWCFGVELWDYNNQPFHITQYSGVLPAVGAGGACYLAFKFIFYPVLGFLKRKLSKRAAKWICWTLGVAVVLDTVFMGVQIVIFKQSPMYWAIRLR